MHSKNLFLCTIIGITALQCMSFPDTRISRTQARRSDHNKLHPKKLILVKYMKDLNDQILEKIAAMEKTSQEINMEATELEKNISKLKNHRILNTSHNRKKSPRKQ